MKKLIYKVLSVLMIAFLILSTLNINVLANVSATKYDTVSEAKKISLNKKYSIEMKSNQDLWLKVPVKSLIKKKTHITVETSGVSNVISVFYSKEKAKERDTDKSYLSKSSPLSYPLAWEGSYYYVNIKAKGNGKLTYKVNSGKKAPDSPQYEDEFCTAEALASTDTSLYSMLNGLRNVRDNLLNKSDLGCELSDYYYAISESLSLKLLTDTTLLNNVIANVKELLPLVNNLILLSEGKTSTYVISQSDVDAIVSIKNELKQYLSIEDGEVGENLFKKFELQEYLGKKLSALIETKFTSTYVTTTKGAYSEYIVTYSGKENISSILKKVNHVLAKNGISASITAEETDDLYGTANKYILTVNGCSDENLISKILKNTKYFDKVNINYQMSLLTNDVQYDYQWYLENSGQEIPHNTSGEIKKIAGKKDADIDCGNMRRYLKGRKKSKVVVAVIDTGINYELADFSGKVNMKDAYNFVSNNTDPMDDNNHGTHVSGIIAASSNNGYSMAGISSNVTILPIKALDSNGSGRVSDLAKAIKYATEQEVDVINLSLGIREENGDPVLPDSCEDVEKALKEAVKKNITIVVAAGNESKDNLSYPANSKYTITVGAINNKDQLASFSNTGEGLDLVAPGVAIASLLKNGEVAVLDGTSMATPIVTAVVANMYSLDQNLNSDRVEAILKKSCRDLGKKGYDTKYGYGCINAEKAVKNVAKKVKSLKISSKTKTLYTGQSTTLEVTVSPSNAVNKKVKWTSSNPKVAKVDSKGNVRAVSTGIATIKAKTVDGSNKTVTCKVTVKKAVKVKSLKISNKTKTLKKGKTFTLKVTVSPTNATNKKVKWTSSNSKVAKVDSKGKVSAVSKGTATIKAMSLDGSNKTVTCKVKVN